MANDQQEEPVPNTTVHGGGDPSKSYVGVKSKVKVSNRLTVTPKIGQFNLKNKTKGVNVRSTDFGIQTAYKINKNVTLHAGAAQKKTKVKHSFGTESSKGKGFNVGISIDF
tara:strand:+ start:1188 stop:1520 length:333 start_codon:yes stop_codon:yes gene_type:complete